MKHIELEGESISYYYKDDEGNTINLPMEEGEKSVIIRSLTVRGDERGKIAAQRKVKPEDKRPMDLMLFWAVEY